MFTNPVLGGNNTLIREAIRSPNYVAGVSGWTINKNGSCEFNNATFRGNVEVIDSTSGGAVYIYSTQGGAILFHPQTQPGITWQDGKIDVSGETLPNAQAFMSLYAPVVSGRTQALMQLYSEDALGNTPFAYFGQDIIVGGYVKGKRPNGRILLNGAQSIPNNAITPVTYTGTDFRDVAGYHNPASNPERVTPTIAGDYRVTVSTCWAGFTGTAFGARSYVLLNGTAIGPAVIRSDAPGNNTQWSQMTSATVTVNGTTDYFGHGVLQTSGGALNVNGSNSNTSTFQTVLEWEYLSD